MYQNFEELLKSITPDIYQKLKQAVELGKWPNGAALSKDQRSLCMQAIIHWEEQNLSAEQRSGYIPPRPHDHCGSTKGNIADDAEQPLQFR